MCLGIVCVPVLALVSYIYIYIYIIQILKVSFGPQGSDALSELRPNSGDGGGALGRAQARAWSGTGPSAWLCTGWRARVHMIYMLIEIHIYIYIYGAMTLPCLCVFWRCNVSEQIE